MTHTKMLSKFNIIVHEQFSLSCNPETLTAAVYTVPLTKQLLYLGTEIFALSVLFKEISPPPHIFSRLVMQEVASSGRQRQQRLILKLKTGKNRGFTEIIKGSGFRCETRRRHCSGRVISPTMSFQVNSIKCQLQTLFIHVNTWA